MKNTYVMEIEDKIRQIIQRDRGNSPGVVTAAMIRAQEDKWNKEIAKMIEDGKDQDKQPEDK